MKKYLLSFAVMVMGSTVLTGCLSDNDSDKKPVEYIVTEGALIINNGNTASSIDGSLTFLDFRTDPISVQQNVFKMVNGKSLGGTPNDVIVHGNKIYIAGSDENVVFVLDKRNFKLLETISTTEEMGDDKGATPRHLVGYNGKVYVSTYGGYVGVIDTLSLTIGANPYKVGSYPEGLAIGGTSDTDAALYVANSDYGNGNASISKINLSNGSITEIRNEKIRNPQELAVAGDVIYVLDWGYYDANDDWKQKEAGVYEINGSTVRLVVPDATGMAAGGRTIVTFNYPYGSTKPTYSRYNIAGVGTLANFSLNGGNPVVSPATIAFDPNAQTVYIASRTMNPDTGYPSYTTDGFVNIYNLDGEFVGTTSYGTGIEPHAIAFTYGTAKLQY